MTERLRYFIESEALICSVSVHQFDPISSQLSSISSSIPSNGKIAKDAKECVQECVSEFVSFVTSEAADRCQQEKRKTINGEDLLFAMSTLGFDSYVEPLKIFLSKYRDSLKTEKTTLGVVAEMEEGMVRQTCQFKFCLVLLSVLLVHPFIKNCVILTSFRTVFVSPSVGLSLFVGLCLSLSAFLSVCETIRLSNYNLHRHRVK